MFLLQNEVPESLETVTEKLHSWWETLLANLPNIGVAIVVLIASYLVSRLIYNVTLKLIYKRVRQTSITKLIARGASIIVVLGGLFLALAALNLGQVLTSLLAGAGVSGLVIGLALQGTLSNTISGIVLSFRNNIQVGNWIETNGFSGEVLDINLNYFVLKEVDNNTVVIPNKQIIENPFKNFSLTKEMRISLECGIDYKSDLEAVQKLTIETISNLFDQEKINKQIEFYYTGFEDSSINFLCRFWIEGMSGLDRLRAKSKAIIQLKKAFDKNGVNIPFPIRTLHVNEKHLTSELKQLETLGIN
ncbi:mechanosensitive ion channel family protein [uncultured Aquimarina sp.]|uniref:mechanosensitive ion channel family protein n=1 Tax=uncultured Aquimarina sp. TaxID=575652 RepID=UPI00261709C9|nr:mechanosensitive ion channel family protein [uncultured Aquimarina sp.]